MEELLSVSTHELLVELIGKHSTEHFYRGSLHELFDVTDTPEELIEHHLQVHRTLSVARELMTRYLAEELAERSVCSSPELVRNYLRYAFAQLPREVFGCLFLDTRNRLIRFEILFRGTLDAATVHPREVVKRALLLNAASVVLAHNHPSGDATPSTADRNLTRQLQDALNLVDIRVIDHIVVGADTIESFAEKGWL